TRQKIVGGSRKACRSLTTTVKKSYRPDVDLGSNLGIGPRFGRCGGSSPGVRQDFVKGIGKIARNTSGDRRRITVRLTIGNAEVAGLRE
ncbi:hypothetical protein BHM03_00037013, partial [Ensete ventricosum]